MPYHQITSGERYAIAALRKQWGIVEQLIGLDWSPEQVSGWLRRHRQYRPKRTSMARVTQADLDAIAERLNARPRKRLGYRTPEECHARA
jgi:IS30 family transposase